MTSCERFFCGGGAGGGMSTSMISAICRSYAFREAALVRSARLRVALAVTQLLRTAVLRRGVRLISARASVGWLATARVSDAAARCAELVCACVKRRADRTARSNRTRRHLTGRVASRTPWTTVVAVLPPVATASEPRARARTRKRCFLNNLGTRILFRPPRRLRLLRRWTRSGARIRHVRE